MKFNKNERTLGSWSIDEMELGQCGVKECGDTYGIRVMIHIHHLQHTHVVQLMKY